MHLLAQQRQQHVPHAALTPAGKGVADLFPGWVVLGQRAPLAAGGLQRVARQLMRINAKARQFASNGHVATAPFSSAAPRALRQNPGYPLISAPPFRAICIVTPAIANLREMFEWSCFNPSKEQRYGNPDQGNLSDRLQHSKPQPG